MAYVWLELPVQPPPVVIARRSVISRHVGEIDHQFSRLGIVDHRLFALTAVGAPAIEAAADLLLRLRAALPDGVRRRYRPSPR